MPAASAALRRLSRVTTQWSQHSMWTAITFASGAALHTRMTSSSFMMMGSPFHIADPACTTITFGANVRMASSTPSNHTVSPAQYSVSSPAAMNTTPVPGPISSSTAGDVPCLAGTRSYATSLKMPDVHGRTSIKSFNSSLPSSSG